MWKWRPPPSGIFALGLCEFDRLCVCGTPFSACDSKFGANAWNIGWLMATKMWFLLWRPPQSSILLDSSSGGKNYPGTLFSMSVSNLVQMNSKSVHKWRSYCHLTDFKMAAAAILDCCTLWILMVNPSAGPHPQPVFQIRCKCVE